MKNSRFERNPYGRAFRAGEGNSNVVSNWWTNAVRETLEPTFRKSPKNSDRLENTNIPVLKNTNIPVLKNGRS